VRSPILVRGRAGKHGGVHRAGDPRAPGRPRSGGVLGGSVGRGRSGHTPRPSRSPSRESPRPARPGYARVAVAQPSDEARSKRGSYGCARDLMNPSQRRPDPAEGTLGSSMPAILIRHTQCQTSHTWTSGRYWA
jgi:hypothetical protein